MADKVVSGVKLTNNRDANINAILNKAKNAQWAYNDLRVLIKDLESVPESKRKTLYGIDNEDVQILKEVRLEVVNDIQKRDRKGIGPDLNYYGEDKATVARLDREYKAARSKENKRLGRINTQTPIQKAAGFVGGFGEGLSLDARAAAYEKFGLPGSTALKTVDPDDPFASSGLRAGHAYGQEYLNTAAGVPGTLLGGGGAAGAVRLASGFLPQTRVAQGALGLLQGAAAIYGGAEGGKFTAGLAQRFSPGARLSDEARGAIAERTAGPERGLASAAAQASIFTPFTKNAEGRFSFLEGQGVVKSAKNLFTGGPQQFNQGALETPIDIAGRLADAMSTNSDATKNNKDVEARLAARFGRPATREELIANGWMTPEEQQIQIGLSLGLGGFTRHGELFTGKHLFNAAQQGVNTLHDRVMDRARASSAVPAATPAQAPSSPSTGLISRPNADKYKFNITVPGLNQAPAEQSRVTFSPGVMSATVEPRVDRIPEQYKTSIAKELRDKVGQVNGVLITGVSADGDFFTQTQQMDGSTKIETKSYQELPDALRQRVRQAMLGVKIDGRAIDADATFDPSRGYTGEYNTNIDAHPVYKNQFPVKVEIDGKEVNAAVMEKVGNANVRLQLPSGNSIVVPSASVIGDATNVTGVRKSSPPRLSKIKDNEGNPIAYEDQGIDFFIPMGQGERKAASETPGSWKEMFKFDRSEWEDVSNTDLQPGTVIKLENLGVNKNIWGVVLRPEQFSFDGEDAYGWRVQPLHDPRAPQIIVEHTGVTLVDPNNPDVIEAAVEAGALDPTMAESAGINADVETPAPEAQEQLTEEEASGTPVELKPTAPSSEAGVSPAVVQTTTSGAGVDSGEAQPTARPGRTNASRAEAAATSTSPKETTGEDAKAESQPASTAEQPSQEQPEAPRATAESTTSTAGEATTTTGGRGRRRVGSRSIGTVQPEDFTFKYGEEFKQTIPDKDLPAEMRSDRRTDKTGQVNAYRRMTTGEQANRKGSDLAIIPFKGVYDNQPLQRLVSAFTLHVDTEKGQEAWNVQVKDATKNGKFGQAEFKQLLIDEWGQTDKQAEALSKYVDRWAVGWAKEIARLSGYNINTVARALRLDTDPKAPTDLEDWEAWKSNYREQQVLDVTEANKKLIAKLVGVFYAQRLGGIVGLTAEQRVSLGRPGATFTLQANGNKVMHVAMALRGKLNYVTQVHEVNHLLVRSLYGPMYHELAAAIRQSFVITGNQEAKTRVITPDVEEQIVTSLTNAIFNSSGVGVIKERFTEGGAINDSTLTQMFNSIGQQMRESIVAGETEWHNDLATNPGWAVRFDAGRSYATDTPILYTIAADRNPVPGVLVSDYNPNTGDKTVAIKYEIDGKEKTERVETSQLRIGQSSVTSLPDAAQRIVAKWMNHWHDWTVEQISDLVPEIKTENFTPITQQDLFRKNVGYQWWRNVDDYRQRARTTQEDASKFSNKRIRARSTYSYLGWLDNPQGQGYNSYIDIDEMMRMERGVLVVRTDGKIMIGGAKGEFQLTPELIKLIEKEKAARVEAEKPKQPEAPKAKAEAEKPDSESVTPRTIGPSTGITYGNFRDRPRPTDLTALSQWIVLHQSKEIAPPTDDPDYNAVQTTKKVQTSIYSTLPKQFLSEAARLNISRSDVKDAIVKHARITSAIKLLTGNDVKVARLRKNFYINTGKAINEYGYGDDGVDINDPKFKKYLDTAEQVGSEYIKDGQEFKAEEPRAITPDVLGDKITGLYWAAVNLQKGVNSVVDPRRRILDVGVTRIDTENDTWVMPSVESRRQNLENKLDDLLTYIIDNKKTLNDIQEAFNNTDKPLSKEMQSTYQHVYSVLDRNYRKLSFVAKGIVESFNDIKDFDENSNHADWHKSLDDAIVKLENFEEDYNSFKEAILNKKPISKELAQKLKYYDVDSLSSDESGVNPNAQATPSERLNTARTMIDSTLPSITQAFKAGNFDKVNSLMKHALETVLRLQAYNKNDHPDHAASHQKFEALVDEVTSFIDGVKADVEAANASKEEITKISDKAADDFLEQLARQSSPDTTPVSQEDADIFGGGGWMSTLANKEDGQVESKDDEKKQWREETDKILKNGVQTLIEVPSVGSGKNKRTDINAWQNRIDSLIENVVTSPMTYVFANRRIREQAIFHDALTGVYISKDTTSKNTRMGDERFQLKSYIDIGVRTRLTSLMRTVSVKNNALYMNIQTEGYIHPVKITPDVIYAEIERAVSTATSQALADYVKQELDVSGTAQDAVLRYMRKADNNFDAAVELAVSTAAFGRWQRYKPENRKWVDIRTLTTDSIGEGSIEKVKAAKSSNEIIRIIQDNPNDFYGTMFAYSVNRLLDPKNGAFHIRNKFEVPLLESTDAQYEFTRNSFKDQLDKRLALSSLDSGDFVEPAAKAEGSMQKLMQNEVDDIESLSDDEQSILNIAKSLLTSPDYFRDMVDSVIKYEESHTKPELTFENLQNRLDSYYQSVAAYKEDLAWEKANDGDESVINGLINSITKQQNIIEQVEGIIANRRNRAAQQSRESMDSMEQVFDALSEMTDKELYSFFLPSNPEDRDRINSLSNTYRNGSTNFFAIHNGLAKNPFSEEAREVLSKLASYADDKEESSSGDVDHYAVMATSIVNVKKMFERATEIYDRSRSIQTRGNLTPRYVKFLDALPVKEAVILDARRVNLQTYKIGSTSSLSDENLQSFIGVGSATYKDALYGSKEDREFNSNLKQRLTKELGQVPSQSQLMAGGYKVSIIDQMNTAEMNALLGTNNKFIDELTLERHKGLFRQLFTYLKSTPTGQPKDATKTVEEILFKDPHTYTVGEKIWMVLNVVENTAGKDKVDSHVNALRTILRKGLEVTEGGTNERLNIQAKNLRMFRRHVSDSMVMPLQRDYVGTRPGGLVEVTTTNPADAKKFAKAVFQHVLRTDAMSILNKEVYDRQGSYSTLVKRINKAMSYSKAAKDAIGSPRTVLSDAELFAIAESYDVPGNEYTIEEKYAFVNAMIEKRDQAINKPLKTWLQDKQKVRAQLTIRDINEYLDQSQMSDVDKKAFISLYTNSLTADKSQLKRFVALTGRLPERQELPAVAKIIDVDIKKLQSEYESVEKLVASVGLDALSYNVVGTSIKITHYNRMIDAVSRHGIFVNIDPSYLQGQDAFARSTWVDLSNMLDMEFDSASPEDAKLTEGILASTLTDMVWSRYVGGSKTKDNLTPPRLVSSLMKAPNQRVKNVSNIRDMDERQKLAMHIHNMSTGALKDVLTDVTRDGIALTDINTSLQKLGKARFVESYNIPSKAMPDRESGFKEYSTEYARNVIAARKEMVRSVNDPTFDNYEYVVSKSSANKPDYSNVKVYDRLTGKNIYEIDYVNGRVFDISSGTRVRVMPVPVNDKGITALHVKLADVIFQGATKEQRAAREDLVYQAMVNEPTLNPVPAVFWHGRYRILQPVDADIYEPMYMSTLRSDPKDVFNSVGAFDPTTEDAYIKPVLDAWTTPDITGNTRVRTDTSGLPFFDGYGYTVTTAEGHRSSVFANLIANGLSKEKALSIYAMTEHPIFKSWQAGDLVESVALRKATSFVDQGRVVDAETYNKVNKVIALNEFTKAVEDYMDNPSQENLDRVEFTYDETELGRHLTEYQLKAKAKSIVKTQADALAYIKTANDMANSLMTEDIAFHVNPYKAHREGEKQIKTGQPFTTLVFEDSSNTFMNMDAPGLRTFDLGSGLSANGSRVNQPYFAKAHNPYVYDAVENGIQWDTMQGLIKKAMKAGHDGLVITNFRPNLLTSERKNILYTFNDSNIRPISEMGTPMYDTPIVISDEIVEPMFMNAPMYAPVTARTVPAASSAVFVEPPKSGKEIAGDVIGYAGDVVQGIARFPLSLDFAFVGIQGAKALLGGFLRPYDTRIALQSFIQSMRGMAPNTSITIGGKRIGFDKLGRRAWLQVYEEMRKDPYFQLMRDLNVPLHFVNFEKNVEAKRRQIYQESGGKIRYEDIKLDMLDFDERGNMTDYFERVTPTTWLPLTGMFERQMSLNHDLLLFNQIKYQLEHNSMFKGLTNEELVKRRDVKALVNFLAMSVGDVQYSTNDRVDAAAGRWGKFIAAAPRWYLSNILMNPIINPAVTALYKAVPKIREVLGENYRGVGLYDYNLIENKELLAYQLKTFVGTAAFTALMPALAELLGRMLGREDITGEQGIGKWRFGNWKFADSSGVWDFWNTALTTADKVVSGTYTPLPKPGDKKSTADWLQQVSNPTLYKVSPVITKLIQTVTGVDVVGRPVYETDKEWMRWYEGFFAPTIKQATGVDLGTKPFVRSLYTTSLSPTSWSAMYKSYYEADWQTARTQPRYANEVAIKQLLAAALGTRTDYDQFVPQAFQGKYRLMQKYKRLYDTGPSLMEIINDPNMHLAPRMLTGEDKF